ncbi:hypothetical protein, partial [Microtetraspora malaysiensis]|uniref:hypothetical protein n=1 Tax=Microtetraspora malaysiensis TaxID=161358 RepID=UPI001C3F3C9C
MDVPAGVESDTSLREGSDAFGREAVGVPADEKPDVSPGEEAGGSSGRDSALINTSNSVPICCSNNAINTSAFRTRSGRSSPTTRGFAYAS